MLIQHSSNQVIFQAKLLYRKILKSIYSYNVFLTLSNNVNEALYLDII